MRSEDSHNPPAFDWLNADRGRSTRKAPRACESSSFMFTLSVTAPLCFKPRLRRDPATAPTLPKAVRLLLPAENKRTNLFLTVMSSLRRLKSFRSRMSKSFASVKSSYLGRSQHSVTITTAQHIRSQL